MEQYQFVSQEFKELTGEELATALATRGNGSTIVAKVGEIYIAGKAGRKPAKDSKGNQRKNDQGDLLWSYGFAGARVLPDGTEKPIDLPWSLFSAFMKGRSEFYSRTKFGRDILEASNDLERANLISGHKFKVAFAEKCEFKKLGGDGYDTRTAYLLEYAD